MAAKVGLCTPHPWAHMSGNQRADLRSAYGTVLHDRIALKEPLITVPEGACSVELTP
jgi:hypothetical protein